MTHQYSIIDFLGKAYKRLPLAEYKHIDNMLLFFEGGGVPKPKLEAACDYVALQIRKAGRDRDIQTATIWRDILERLAPPVVGVAAENQISLF